jgi:signal transduction histidine kinase
VRRQAPVVVVAVGVALLLGSYVLYTRRVVTELRREAERSVRLYGRVYEALQDPSDDGATTALVDLSRMIGEAGVPVVVTDVRGVPAAAVNLPFDAPLDDPRVRAYVDALDRENPPVVQGGIGAIHFGTTPLVRGLRVVPLLQAASLALLIVAGIVVLRTHGRAERERVWAGMARESAHQLGTPLTSLHGWMELIRERAGDPLMDRALDRMGGDIERLERVAHRFERIGRPPRRDPVDVGALVTAVTRYFQDRVPTLAHRVTVAVAPLAPGLTVRGDRVLLEWALESLVKNAIDALAGRGGTVAVSAEAAAGGQVRIRVADDGPGVPRALRARIFDAGFSTKERGWGIGLPLTRRIVEENHGGRLVLQPSPKGAVFDVILPG